MGRHGAPTRRGRGAGPGTGTVVVVALLVALLAGAVAWRGWVATTGTGPFLPWAGCERTPDVSVVTTAAMAPVVKDVAADLDDVCARFTVTAEAPDVTVQRYAGDGEGAPDVWLPDSSLLAEEVAEGDRTTVSVGGPVAATPVLIAVPSGLEAPAPASWGTTIVAPTTRLPEPTQSTVGRIALMVGLAEIDALPAAARSTSLSGIGGMLSRVVPEASLLSAHAGGTDPAVFPTTEQAVHEAAPPGLSVVVPASATPALEYPVVTSRSAPAEAVAALTAALTSAAGSDALRAAGFRTPRDRSPVVEGGPAAAALDVEPSPEQAAAAQRMWAAVATPTRLLTVIDTSGSMAQSAASGGSRIEVASRAATGAIQLLADHNSVGLWTFSTRQQGDRDWTQLQAVGELGREDQRARLAFSLGSLATRLGGDTGLYDTLDAAYRRAVEDHDPTAANLVALFTDGVNDDPAGGLTLAQLTTRLREVGSADTPVTVLLVGMGGVDARALAPVARAVPTGGGGGAAVFTVEKPEDIADVYVTMLLRRVPQQG
ncbi:substrate-binding domain-containing protein [Oryzobacter terrae]|uniref:substrate-binding domain-containing protein n=1 Tax=Oryzobacter terrae TaxID=1620385 RepID=UPI00366C67D5